MESVFEGLGIAAIVILILAGLGVGALIGLVTGRGALLYAAIGAVAALATPFLLAALGVTALAAGGIILIAVVGAVGALLVVGLIRAIRR